MSPSPISSEKLIYFFSSESLGSRLTFWTTPSNSSWSCPFS